MKNNVISLAKERHKRKPLTPAESVRIARRLFFDKIPEDVVEPESLASGGDMTKILEEVDDDEADKG